MHKLQRNIQEGLIARVCILTETRFTQDIVCIVREQKFSQKGVIEMKFLVDAEERLLDDLEFEEEK